MLTSKEIKIIKSFPDSVLQTVKKYIQSLPRPEYQTIKSNFEDHPFKTICDLCIAECKKRNMKIDKIMYRLQEYARANPEPVFEPQYKQRTYKQFENRDFRKGSKSYQLFKKEEPVKINHDEANLKINSIIDNKESFNNFAMLVGEEYAIKYQKRMIDSIISIIG